MQKTILALILLLISSTAYAGIVSTWNFDGSTPAFASGYQEWWEAGDVLPAGNMGEGRYSIVPSSTTVHEAFKPAFSDHTTGSGNFMIVNGDDEVGGADTAFFTVDLSAVAPGDSYTFTFYAANAYGGYAPWNLPANPAELGVKLDGDASYINTFQLVSTVGVWQQYSISFSAPQSGGRLGVYDLNRQLWGNDFAFDDAVLTSNAPEPSTWMFAVGGLAAMLLLRRKRRA